MCKNVLSTNMTLAEGYYNVQCSISCCVSCMILYYDCACVVLVHFVHSV